MADLLPLREAHTKFLKFLEEKNRASATILAYGKDIEQLIEYLEEKGKKNVDQVLGEDLKEFMQSLASQGYTPKSVSRKTNSTKTFFRFLKAGNFIQDDPASSVSHPKYEIKPPRVLSKLEYRALRDACRDDVRTSAVVEILLQTGIRIGELATLTVDDVKGDKMVVRDEQGKEDRDIPLNKAVQVSIQNWLKERPESPSHALFITKTGNPLLVRNIRTSIDRYFKLAGINNAKVNDLRHTFIAHHLMAGASLVLVSRLAGHKRLSTTEKYLDLIKDKIEQNTKLGEL
ncbi:MAG TPA: tyrosine-type recombinase/integrase [Patescibacteria group bacterium]|nr:tyrosine-type recombinase/integrase [Patescibacteria group bacterium]